MHSEDVLGRSINNESGASTKKSSRKKSKTSGESPTLKKLIKELTTSSSITVTQLLIANPGNLTELYNNYFG